MKAPTLFFDGICNLCRRSVRFVKRHDHKGRIQLLSLQSNEGEVALEQVKQQFGKSVQTVIFFNGTRYYIESDAVLQLSKLLDFPWNLLRIFRIVPRFIRDPLYRLVARNRYHWFGTTEQCMIPKP